MFRRFVLRTMVVLAVAGSGLYAWFQLSPWPSAMLIRLAFDRDAVKASQALARHVPAGVVERLDIPYLQTEGHLRLDIFRPAADGMRPVVVWVHGGAWISGDKAYIANYLRILASEGFATIGVGYDIAPAATYPTPVRQVNAALRYLSANAGQLGLDMNRVVLAGDSAGAQIAAQVGLVLADPDYASRMRLSPGLAPDQLRGLLLHCGGYDIGSVDFTGPFGGFLRTVFWSYFGTRDFVDDPRMSEFSILENLSSRLPPLFVSAGNADPLLPQSRLLAERATAAGIEVDTLFFPHDRVPALGHEYQFDLDDEAGRLALRRGLAFLRQRLSTSP